MQLISSGFRKKIVNQGRSISAEPSRFWEMQHSTTRIWPTTGNPKASEERRLRGVTRSSSPSTWVRSSGIAAHSSATGVDPDSVALSKWAIQPLADFVANKSIPSGGRAASTGNQRHASNTEFTSVSTKTRLNLSGEVSGTPQSRSLRRSSPFSDRNRGRASPITGIVPMHIQGGGDGKGASGIGGP